MPLCDACIRAKRPCNIRDVDFMISIEVCPHFINKREKEQELLRMMEAFIL